MDLWGDDFREPSEDDRSARRVLAVAIAFVNAPHPLTTSEVRLDLYPDLKDDAFRKAFARDRERLAMAGLVVRRQKSRDGEVTWATDEEASFAHENLLTPEDALTLDFLLLPLVSDPSFPYSRDLRMALSKIDRSFDGSSSVAIPPQARTKNPTLGAVEESLAQRRAVRVTYKRADGSLTRRDIAPYGLFCLNESAYLVAARLDGGDGGAAHTYNLARMQRVQPLRKTYVIPAEFDVRDYVLLPFQVGPITFVASFLVPDWAKDELRGRVASHGTWTNTQDGAVFEAQASDVQRAASWAIAEGVRPLGPPELVEAWRARLHRASEARV